MTKITSRKNPEILDTKRIGVIALIIIIICGFSYGLYLYQQNDTKKDDTLILTGTVTSRNGALADAGNYLTVDGLQISTGGGSLSANPAKYISNISNIHKGDRVEVRYIKDKYGSASTNCASCYVKKL